MIVAPVLVCSLLAASAVLVLVCLLRVASAVLVLVCFPRVASALEPIPHSMNGGSRPAVLHVLQVTVDQALVGIPLVASAPEAYATYFTSRT